MSGRRKGNQRLQCPHLSEPTESRTPGTHGVDQNSSHPESLSSQGRFSSTGLQRMVRTAEKINRELTSSHPGHAQKHCLTRTRNIRRETSQPHRGLFMQLNCSLHRRTARFHNGFFPYAMGLLNTNSLHLPSHTHITPIQDCFT